MNLQPFIGQWLRHNSQRNPDIPTRKTGIPVGILQEYVGECKELYICLFAITDQLMAVYIPSILL